MSFGYTLPKRFGGRLLMRKLTVLLATVFLLLLGFAAWFYFGGTLRAQVYIQTA